MHALLLFPLFAEPFWEAKPAREWNDQQLLQMLTDSPWAQLTEFKNNPSIPVYLATSKPLRDAESEWLRRYSLKAGLNPNADQSARREYELFLQDNASKVIVLAIRGVDPRAMLSAGEVKHMEEESYLKAGKRKIKMSAHFPPAESDPMLRLVFPRPSEAAKELSFEIYIPGLTAPYRQAVFRWKDLMFRGEPQM